jgi:hypothetical protein
MREISILQTSPLANFHPIRAYAAIGSRGTSLTNVRVDLLSRSTLRIA